MEVICPSPAVFANNHFAPQMTVGPRNNKENEKQSVTKDDSTKPKPERQLSDKQKTYSEDSVDGCANAHVISVHGISQNGDFSKEDHVHNGDVEERMEEVQSKTDCLSISSAVEENIDDACEEDVTFSDEFTHEKGGTLQKEGSEVILTVPSKAVPPGTTYTVTGTIHRNLKDYNQWMKNDNEYIVGPVAEYKVKGGGDFDIGVTISIPHCMNTSKGGTVRVLYGSGEDFKEVTEDDDMTYTVDDQYVHILTKHFTRFMVTYAQCEADQERVITDALLTVAASKHDASNKSFIKLRLMLHNNCASLNDFSAERSHFYDSDMEEIGRMKVNLPNKGEPLAFPTIAIKAAVDKDCEGWGIKDFENDERAPSRELTINLDGQDVLTLPSSAAGPSHRSEQLIDFVLERKDGQDEPLICSVKVNFIYSEQLVKEHNILVVFPTRKGRRESFLKTNSLNEVFKEISNDIGKSFGRLATHLNVTQQTIQELERNYPQHFERNYNLLTTWREAAALDGNIDTLVAALEKCERNDLALKAREVYENNTSPSPGAASSR